MSDPNNAAPGSNAQPSPATPDGTQVTPPAAPDPTQEMANPSKRDWADAVKTNREIQKKQDAILEALGKLTPAAPVKAETKTDPAPTGAQDSAAMAQVRKLELRLALAESGVTDPELRELMTQAVEAAKPQDVGEFVAKYAAKLKPPGPAAPVKTETPTTPQPPPPPGGSDTGPPAKPNPAIVNPRLNEADAAAFRALPYAERKQKADEFLASGGTRNPYRRVGGKT